MDKELQEWFYLSSVTGSFEDLYRYYFNALAGLAPVFRQTGTALMYSLALAWAGFCALRAPLDRLASALGILLMVVIAGFLNSPTTNNKHIGNDTGYELSIGGYYAFLVTGTIVRLFDYVSAYSMSASVKEFGGEAGNTREVIATAFGNESKNFLDRFVHGEGRAALEDYYDKCATPALKVASTKAEMSALMGVGVGSNNIGLDAKAQTHLVQQGLAAKEGGPIFKRAQYHNPNAAQNVQHFDQIRLLDAQRNQGIEFLKKLDPSITNITGEQGYRIPKAHYYQQLDPDDKAKAGSPFEQLSTSNSNLSQMHAPGANETEPNTDADTVFYPKNCAELFAVAQQVMANLRTGVADDPAFKNLPFTGGYNAFAVANRARQAIQAQSNDLIAQADGSDKMKNGQVDAFADRYFSFAADIGNEINEWMLEFKIPAMTAMMALMVVTLIICFPIFAVLSVIFGSGVLITYLKMMALPFLVVFINRFILAGTALIVHFDMSYEVVINTFMPNTAHAANSLSGMTTKSIAFLLICAAEITIAKLLLWDDVKGLAGMDIGKASTASAERGHEAIISAGAFALSVAAMFATGGTSAAAQGAAKGAKAANTAKNAAEAEKGAMAGHKASGGWASKAEMGGAAKGMGSQFKDLARQVNSLANMDRQASDANRSAQEGSKYNAVEQSGGNNKSLRPPR